MSYKINLDYEKLNDSRSKLVNLHSKVLDLKTGSVTADMFVNSKGIAADALNELKDNLAKTTELMCQLINRTENYVEYTSKQFNTAEEDKVKEYSVH